MLFRLLCHQGLVYSEVIFFSISAKLLNVNYKKNPLCLFKFAMDISGKLI
jgi:hypothetical protein